MAASLEDRVALLERQIRNPGSLGPGGVSSPAGIILPFRTLIGTPTELDPVIRHSFQIFTQILEQAQPAETSPGIHDWGVLPPMRMPRLSANLTAIQSNTTLANIDDGSGGVDTNIKFNLAASRSFWFMGGFFYNSGAIPDIKFHFTGPSGWAAYALFVGFDTTGVFTIQPWDSSMASIAMGGTGANAWCFFLGNGSTSTTAGAMQAQYAQNTSTASNTQMLTPSTALIWFR